jgi:ethanolamine utilization protein EutS
MEVSRLPLSQLRGGFVVNEEKKRFIQEFVPGKQVTLSHIIANPDPDMFEKLGIQEAGALGILTLTPSETVIIAGDLATKSANVKLGFLDRFTGSLVIVGNVSEVEMAMQEINRFLQATLKYTPAEITKS